MRFKRTLLALLAATSLTTSATGYAYVRDYPPPHWDLDAGGCPTEYYRAPEHGMYPVVGKYTPAHLRPLAAQGADAAVLCTDAFMASAAKWHDRLTLTRGLPRLIRLMNALPRTDQFGPHAAVAYTPVNLVLRYPDGRSLVLAIDGDLVSGHQADRARASRIVDAFQQLWIAEHAEDSPAATAETACPASIRADPLPNAPRVLPETVREGGRHVPFAAATACRYRAAGHGRLTLRAQGSTRSGLPELAALADDARRRLQRRKCGAWKQPIRYHAIDVLYLTDVTGRTETHIATDASSSCTAQLALGPGSVGTPPPEFTAAFTALLDRVPS